MRTISRRKFLTNSAIVSATAVTFYNAPLLASATDALSSKRFVWVLLRGGMDGINALIPYEDSNYARLRENLALAKPGGADSAIKISADFALHPALKNFAQWYQNGEMIAFPATASVYRERSHFDGQNVLENGGLLPFEQKDGWLNRALSTSTINSPSGLAVGSAIPLSLQGELAVQSWSPSVLPEAEEDVYNRLADLYAEDDQLSMRLASLQKTRQEVAQMDMAGERGRNNSAAAFNQMAIAAGKLMANANGPQVATLELGGWDTHAAQGAETGQMANQLRALDNGLNSLRQELGSRWQETSVVVMTEFGRTARVNGTNGTDHGTASTAFMLGGAVKGGRIVGDWPGLNQRELFEERDLRPTLDTRSILKGALSSHLGLDEAILAEKVFPSSRSIDPLEGLTIS